MSAFLRVTALHHVDASGDLTHGGVVRVQILRRTHRAFS